MSHPVNTIIDEFKQIEEEGGFDFPTSMVKCQTCGCETDLNEFDQMLHWSKCPRLNDEKYGDFSGASDEHGFANDR